MGASTAAEDCLHAVPAMQEMTVALQKLQCNRQSGISQIIMTMNMVCTVGSTYQLSGLTSDQPGLTMVLEMSHTSGWFESKAGGMLRKAIHVLNLWEAEVKGNGFWAFGLAVCVALEAFLPPPFRVTFLLIQGNR